MSVRTVVKTTESVSINDNKESRCTVCVDVTEGNTTTNVSSNVFNACKSKVNLWGIVSGKADTSYNLDTKGDTRQRSKASEIREVDGARIAVQVVRNRRKKRVAYRSDIEAHNKKDLEK